LKNWEILYSTIGRVSFFWSVKSNYLYDLHFGCSFLNTLKDSTIATSPVLTRLVMRSRKSNSLPLWATSETFRCSPGDSSQGVNLLKPAFIQTKGTSSPFTVCTIGVFTIPGTCWAEILIDTWSSVCVEDVSWCCHSRHLSDVWNLLPTNWKTNQKKVVSYVNQTNYILKVCPLNMTLTLLIRDIRPTVLFFAIQSLFEIKCVANPPILN